MKQLIFILVGMLILQGCASQAEFGDAITEGEPTPIPTSVIPTRPIYDVERGNIVDERSYSGRISPVNDARLSFVIDGVIEEVFYASGDDVVEGDIIATIDTTSLEDQLIDAEETLAIAQSLLTTAENQIDFAEKEALLNVDLAQVFLEFAQLQARDLPSSEADLLVRQREIELEIAELQLEQLEEGVDPSLIFDVTRAQEAVKRINDTIAQAVLTAPISGRITALLIEGGDPVIAFDTIGIVSDLNELEVTDVINRDESSALTEGLPVIIQRANSPDAIYEGTIAFLPQPFGTGTDDRIHIAFNTQPPSGEFELGERISFEVKIAERDDVLWLPVGAIRQFSGRDFVVVQEDGVERRVDVELGLEGGNRVEIIEGVEEGQRVIAP